MKTKLLILSIAALCLSAAPATAGLFFTDIQDSTDEPEELLWVVLDVVAP